MTLTRYTGVLESMRARADERLDEAFRAIAAQTDQPAGTVYAMGN